MRPCFKGVERRCPRSRCLGGSGVAYSERLRYQMNHTKGIDSARLQSHGKVTGEPS